MAEQVDTLPRIIHDIQGSVVFIERHAYHQH